MSPLKPGGVRAMLTHLTIPGADDVNLHAVSAGDRGPLMLFLHGFPEFWQAWHRQLDEFSKDFRAVALDLRGYNLSDKPRGVEPYALPNIVEDIRRVLRVLSPGRPAILVGHDWGGIIGWCLARESPELLDRLIIINAPHPVIFFRELKQSMAQRIASSYAALFQIPGVAEKSLEAFEFAGLRKMVFGTSAKPDRFSDELRKAYEIAWSRPYALTAGLNYYRNRRELKAMLKQPPGWLIRVRTLVLWGDEDPALLKGNVVELDAFVPQLTLQRHATATHWIVHEEPEWVNAAIRDFVRSV